MLTGMTGSSAGSDVSVSEDEVSTLLDSHSDWESTARLRAMSVVDHLSGVVPVGQPALPSMSLQELQSHQRRDPSIAPVLCGEETEAAFP